MSQQKLLDMPEPVIGDVEQRLRKRGIDTVVGVDEAGRGPLAGPVYAAAFWLDLREPLPEALDALDDSKKLDVSQRDELYERLNQGDFDAEVASRDAGVIDEVNVLQATFQAMESALSQLCQRVGECPDLVLIDGNLTVPQGPDNQQAIVGGDAKSLAIAAASIFAKVLRDREMIEADREFPHYGFASNKGYGTAQHRQALREYGPCPLHRRSFAGVVDGGE